MHSKGLINRAFHAVSLCVILLFNKTQAQTITTYTSDSLKSGTAKDVVVSFLQLAVNNLTGTNKEFRFTTNPYDFYQRIDPDIGIDWRYNKWTLLRRTNIGFGLKLDSTFRYNGFTNGITIAVIDHTDPTTSSWYKSAIQEIPVSIQLKKLQNKLTQRAEKEYPNHSFRNDQSDSSDYKKFIQFRKDENDYLRSQVKYNSINNANLKKWVDEIVEDENLTEIDAINENDTATFKLTYVAGLNKYKSQLKKAALLTIGVSDTTYKDKFQFSNVNVFLEFNKGVFNPQPRKNNFELNAKALYSFVNDTLMADRNLQRQIFDGMLKLNWVVREKRTDQSFFEAALGIGYHYITQGLYKDEEASQFTLNSTLRVRVFSDVWLPIEVKYDPATGNVFGLLNVKVNFSGIGALMNKTGNTNN